MAQQKPLFLDTLSDLKRELRLSGIDGKADVQAILERCVARFRVEAIQKLGFTKLTELEGVAYTTTPSTQLEYERMAARLLEVKYVWCHLICELPVHFADASGDDFQALNDEGVWRQLDSDDRTSLLGKCENELAELWDIVVGVQEDSEIHTFDGSPDCGTSAYPPGGSAFYSARPFRGNFRVPTLRSENGRWLVGKGDCDPCS